MYLMTFQIRETTIQINQDQLERENIFILQHHDPPVLDILVDTDEDPIRSTDGG